MEGSCEHENEPSASIKFQTTSDANFCVHLSLYNSEDKLFGLFYY
jgi:hypothetical protein